MVSIFRVEKAELFLPPVFTLVSCSAYSSTLKMEAACSSETSVDFQTIILRIIPKERILDSHRREGCENLKCYST
jgi:hypothetical protein